MWFKLAGADFSKNNLGTMSSISSSYLINYSKLTGMSGTPTSVSYAGSSAGTAKSVEVTITITSGYSFKNGSKITASGGATGAVFTADKDYVGGNTFKFSMNITGNVELTGAAEAVSTGGGSSSGGGGESTDPTPGDTTTPVGVDKVLLSNYRSETGTTLNSGTYGTSAKDTHVTFFDIPINPSEVYYVSWGVRAWFLKSDKSPISTINFYTASDVGKAHYVMAPSNAAYMSVCISNTLEGYSLPDAYIQQASLSFTATSSQLVSATAGVSAMQDNKGLNSASYIVEDKDGSWVYEYIPIVAGQSYRIEGGVRSWFLNSSKTSISTVNLLQAVPKFTFTAPNDAAYISVTFSDKQWTGEKDAVKIEEGTIDYTLK